MSKYTFTPTERLRLEIERDPEPGEYVNLIRNPDGALGAWGWTTPTAGAYMDTLLIGGDPTKPALRYLTAGGSVVEEFYALPIPVTPGEQIRAQWEVYSPLAYRARFRWFDVNGNQIATSTSDDFPAIGGTSATHRTTARTVPVDVRFAAFSLRVTAADFTDTYPFPGSGFTVTNVRVFTSDMGPLTDTAMSANAGAPNVLWENVMGPTLDINVRREEFDLGTMSATILDATIDPAVASTIRPGSRVRLTALRGSASGVFAPLFTGTIDVASVQYDLRTRKADDPKHARISLTAVDAMQVLSSTKRSHGVDYVGDLPRVLEVSNPLEALPVPWDCDGATWQLPNAFYSSSSDSASVADQVALTRDQNLGAAWIDGRGVLMVRSVLPSTVDYTFDESVYSDLNLSFDTRRLINSVEVKVLFYNSGTDETTEGGGDVYVDPTSLQKWGRRQRTFTLTSTKLAEYDDFAAVVFAANANPKIQPQSATVPVLTDPDRAARAFVDLYDLVRVVNVDKGIDDQLRATSIEHRISTDMWLMQVGFAGDSTVAIPQRQPTR